MIKQQQGELTVNHQSGQLRCDGETGRDVGGGAGEIARVETVIRTADDQSSGRRILVAPAGIDEQFAVERPADADPILGRHSALQFDALTSPNDPCRTHRPLAEVEIVLARHAITQHCRFDHHHHHKTWGKNQKIELLTTVKEFEDDRETGFFGQPHHSKAIK